jgi:RNA ligase (TIGR02306 family)
MRKMATIRRINDIVPIPGADAIECAVVGGWKVVVKKGEFNPGDLAVYCEIDSWVPHELAPFLGRGSEPKEYEGVLGYRLRTITLRGQISQGLLLPIDIVWRKIIIIEGEDVSGVLNIQKYEAPIPAELAGEVVGPFPSHIIPKTDEERVQNIAPEDIFAAGSLIFTEKLDGTSATFIKQNGKLRVCGRNWEFVENDNTYWRIARELDLLNEMQDNTAIQGEIVGPGIQGNKYRLKKHELFVFSMYVIDNLLDSGHRKIWHFNSGFQSVPVLAGGLWALERDVEDPIAYLLKWAEGPSELNPEVEREGIVIRSADLRFSCKAISNKFLLKHKE